MHVQNPLLNSENMKFTSLSFSADGTGVEWSGLSALNCIWFALHRACSKTCGSAVVIGSKYGWGLFRDDFYFNLFF